MPTAPFSPAVFTVTGTGYGQALILNQDGTLNSMTNPATLGSLVTLFVNGTDLGPTDIAPVSVSIGGFPVAIIGTQVAAVPGLGIDALQLQVRVPNLTFPVAPLYRLPPSLAVRVRSGDLVSHPGVSIAVTQ